MPQFPWLAFSTLRDPYILEPLQTLSFSPWWSSAHSIIPRIFRFIHSLAQLFQKIFNEHSLWDRHYTRWQNQGPLHCMTAEGTIHLEWCAKQWHSSVVSKTNMIPTLVGYTVSQKKYKQKIISKVITQLQLGIALQRKC